MYDLASIRFMIIHVFVIFFLPFEVTRVNLLPLNAPKR